jgi:hypothetical protein
MTENGSLALPTYHFSYFLGICLASYGFFKIVYSSSPLITKPVRYLLILNLILTLYWLLPLLIFIPSTNLLVGLAYKCWLPFAVYAFIKVPEKKLIQIFKIITLVVAGFIFLDFISLNTTLIPNGYNLTIARYKLLRPEFITMSRTGIFLRPNGILGEGYLPHDSANLLAIFSVYWLALSFHPQKGNFIVFLLAVISIITLLLTQSASNIIAGFVGLLFVLFTYRRNVFSLKNNLKLILLFLPLCTWIYTKYSEGLSMLWVWNNRISASSGDWEGMVHFGSSSFGANLFSFLFGYGQTLEISEVGGEAEQAFIKAIFEYGILHASIFHLFLFAPVIIYIINRANLNKMDIFPYVIAIFVGFLSLWHYGSILRTTNILIFFSMYGQVIRMDAKAKFQNTYA